MRGRGAAMGCRRAAIILIVAGGGRLPEILPGAERSCCWRVITMIPVRMIARAVRGAGNILFQCGLRHGNTTVSHYHHRGAMGIGLTLPSRNCRQLGKWSEPRSDCP